MENKLNDTLLQLKAAARLQRARSSEIKNQALLLLSDALKERTDEILKANAQDLEALPQDTAKAFRDRLLLNPARIEAMALSLRQVASLPDPVGEVVDDRTLENGLRARRVRSPLGVIFMIFESRPNVILEAFSLAFKSGNVILLRGGSESAGTAQVIYKLMSDVLARALKDGSEASGGACLLPFYGLEDYSRPLVEELLQRKDVIDIVVPRGGEKLIEFVQKTARMPIIKNDRGLCHVYVAASADPEMAKKIVLNAKTQRPGVCNSLETLLIDKNVGRGFLQSLFAAAPIELEWRCDEHVRAQLTPSAKVIAVQAEDWDTEHLDMILNCREVDGLDAALAHIDRHGSKHSEAIVTKDAVEAKRFLNEVDAAAVYWNASTRFTDGFELGLGGELGISTQKLHVRGPVGLKELTIPRWILEGDGQIRE